MPTRLSHPRLAFRLRRVLFLPLLFTLPLTSSGHEGLSDMPTGRSLVSQVHAGEHPPTVLPDEIVSLKVGEAIERRIKGSEAHRFSVSLEAGQYAHLSVKRDGVDLLVTVGSPDGAASLTYENPAGAQGTVYASILTDSPGVYLVKVRPIERWAAPGRYTVRVDETRARGPEDDKRLEAERRTSEGRRLQLLELPEGRRAALAAYEAALRLWEQVEDQFEVANTLHFIAQTYQAMSNFDESRRYYQLALDRRGESDPQAVAYTLLDFGAAQRDLKDPLEAVPIFERALTMFRQAQNRRGEAAALYGIGFSYMRVWDMTGALEYLSPALSLYRAEGVRYEEARTLNSLGGAHDVLLKPQEAIGFYKSALDAWDATGDLSNKGLTLNNLGKIYDDLGEWQTALDHYDLALQSYAVAEGSEAVGERHKASLRRRKATTLYNLAYTYIALGDLPKTFDYLGQSLALHEEPRGRGITLTMIGYAHTLSGDPQQALKSCREALPLLTQTNDPRRSQTLTAMGIAYDMLGDHQKAIEVYEQALTLQQNPQAPDYQSQALTLDYLGLTYASMGEADKALAAFERARTLWGSFGERNGEAIALYHSARVERGRGRAEASLKYTEAAIERAELLRGNITNRQLRASYLATKLGYYELYIDLKMLAGDASQVAAAFEASERARSRSLLDMLSDRRVEVGAESNPALAALVERRRRLLQEMRVKAECRLRLVAEKGKEDDLARLDQEIGNLDTERGRIEARIRSEHPRYAALMFPQPLTTGEVQRLLAPDTILLEFFLGEENSYLWALTTNGVSGHRLPRRAEIEQAARQLKNFLRAGQPRRKETAAQRRARMLQAEADYWREASALSRVLLGPVAAQLEGKRLLIVADGELLYLPFGALPSPNANLAAHGGALPLIRNQEVVNLPSASVLAALRQSTRRGAAQKSVAVFADPVFEKDDPRIQAAAVGSNSSSSPPHGETVRQAARDTDESGDGEKLPRLPSTNLEAQHILSLAPRDSSMEATGFKASRENATDAGLAQYRIVHFATHGILDEQRPELSGLVLSLYDQEGRFHDKGYLRLSDIYGLNLPVELVVLSACRTGLGKKVGGEGFIGLTRGFMYAGAPRVISSLWKVDDEATAELMKRFYQKMLKDGLTPAAALRAAQASMSEQRRWGNPYYWAGFVLQGEWR